MLLIVSCSGYWDFMVVFVYVGVGIVLLFELYCWWFDVG